MPTEARLSLGDIKSRQQLFPPDEDGYVPTATIDFTERALKFFERINYPVPKVGSVPGGCIYLTWTMPKQKLGLVVDRKGHWYRIYANDPWGAMDKINSITRNDVLSALVRYDPMTSILFRTEPSLKEELPV